MFLSGQDIVPVAQIETYPEKVHANIPHLGSISNAIGHQPGTKIASEIEGKSGLPTEGYANAEYYKEESEREKSSGGRVSVIFDGEDGEHNNCAAYELGEKLPGGSHKIRRDGPEHARCSCFRVSRDCADTGPALVDINRRYVVAIDDQGAAKCPEDLPNDIQWKFLPWESTKDAEGEGDSGIQVTARDAASIGTKEKCCSDR
jgi:hypothetical protein